MDTPEAVVDQSQQFQATRLKAVAAGDTALRAIAAALGEGKRESAMPAFQELDFLFDVVAMADAASRLLRERPPAAKDAECAVPEYLASTLFLKDCAAYLVGDPHGRERLVLITGSRRGSVRTLERMVEVALSEQSTTCAVADSLDLQRKLIAIDHAGHSLHGLFHSHPGQGRGATRPSGTDLATHQQHERGGYPLVGGIFERSGFVRFFSYGRPFTVSIYGKGVDQYEENLYKIGNVSHDTPWPGGHWDRDRDHSAREGGQPASPA
jgi:Prokaryotic homologs of the JAB domain